MERGAGGEIMSGTAIFFIIILTFSTCWAETYRWVDEKGTVNFTQDYGSIPEKYRDQVKEKPDEPGVEPKLNKKPQETLKGNPGKGLQKSPGKDRVEEPKANKHRIESDAAEALRTIVSLWKEEKYETLYGYGTDASRVTISKEKFVQRMKKKNWGLASSWETLQDIEARFKKPTLVYVTARIGHKPKQGGNAKILTDTYQMKLENGVWKTDLSKILRTP
jgi:hypothetical protein